MKKKIIYYLFCIFIICILLIFVPNISKATEETVAESTKYLILEERGYITRIVPETELAEFKQGFNISPDDIHIYQDSTMAEEVTSGYIKTKMCAVFDGTDQKFELSVIGDIDADGEITQIDLNRLIKHVVGLQEAQLEGLPKISADLSSDGNINQVDITIMIRYIMEHELFIPEIVRPDAPTIAVISGEVNPSGSYKGEVKVQITENLDSGVEIGKTIYKISGSITVEETEIESEGIITLTNKGEYKITAFSYSLEGARSSIVSKTIKITGLPPDLYDEEKAEQEGKEPNVTVSKSDEDWTNEDVIVKIELDEGVNPDGEYELQYKDENGEWKPYDPETGIIVSENTEIEVNLTDGENNGGSITIVIDNIDKNPPEGSLNVIPTQDKVIVNVDAKDDLSGINEYIYQIGKVNEDGEVEWQEPISSSDNNYIFENLEKDTTYKVKVEIIDKAGNKTELEEEVTTLENGTSGQFIQISQDSRKWTSQSVKVTLTATTNQYKTEYSIDGATWTEFKSIQELTITENTTVYGRTMVGEQLLEIVSLEVTNIDKKAPEAQIEISDITSKSFKATLNAKDEISGIAKLIWYYKPADSDTYEQKEYNYVVVGSTGQGAKEQNTTFDYINLISGTYWVCAEVTDAAGNSYITDTIYVEPEVITSGIDGIEVTQSNSNWTNESVDINIVSKDDRYTVLTSTDEEEWVAQTEYTLYENDIIYSKLTDGINSGEILKYEVTNIDTEKPEVQIEQKDVTSKSFTANLNIQDNASGLGQIKWYYKKDGDSDYIEVIQDYTEINGSNAGELETQKELFIDNLTSGTYQVYAIVIDVAGNETRTDEISITLVTITTGEDGLKLSKDNENWTNQPVTVNAELLDEKYTVQLKSSETDWEDAISLTLLSNDTVYARLTDGVNYGEQTSIQVTNIDKEIVNATMSNIDTTSKSFTIQADITDNASGLAQIDWYIKKDGEEEWKLSEDFFEEINGSVAGELDTSKEKEYNILTTGSYQVYALITDVAGNIAVLDSNGASEQDPNNPDYNPDDEESAPIDTTLVTITDGKDGIEFISSNENWTNQNVTITANSTDERYTVLTSTDEQSWSDNAKVEFSANGTIYARLTDGINTGTYTSRQITNIDKEPIVVTVDQIVNITTKSFTNQIDITDNASGLSKIQIYYKKQGDAEYKVQEENYQQLNGNVAGETDTSKNILVDNLETGTYLTYAQITDVAGNITTTKEKELTLLDMPAGDVALTLEPNNTNWTNEPITVNVHNTDDRYSVQVSLDGLKWEDTDQITIDKNETVYSRLTDGINFGEAASITITNIDTIKPEGNVQSISTTSKSMEIQVEAQDEASGIAQITWYYQKEGEAAQSKTINYKTINGSEAGEKQITESQIFDNLINGTYEVWAVITDVASNVTTTEKITVILDTITPGETALTLTPNITYWTNENVTVNVTNTDSKYTVQTSINGKDWNNETSVNTDKNITIYARLFDGVNGGEAATYTVGNIDKDLPVLANINSTPGGTSVSLSLGVTDNLSGIAKINWYYKLTSESSYKVTTNDYVDINGTVKGSNNDTLKTTISNLIAGSTYNVYVEVYDVAGNMVSTQNSPIEVITNTAPEAPTVTFSSKTTNSITVQAKANDADGDNLTYTLYTSTSSNGQYSQADTATAKAGNNVTLTASNLSNYTTYYYYVTVTDQIANNQSGKANQKTYCPGTGHTGTYCEGTTTTSRTCTGCRGSGTIESSYTCSSCRGSGGSYEETSRRCSACGGSGTIETTCSSCGGSGRIDRWITCATCSGTGTVTGTGTPSETCPSCGGSGQIYQTGAWCTACGGSGGSSRTCGSCGGSGEITSSEWVGCGACGGSGSITSYDTCYICRGSGTEYVTTAGCKHGYSTSHYYCTTHNYTGTSSSHCIHGKSYQHDD